MIIKSRQWSAPEPKRKTNLSLALLWTRTFVPCLELFNFKSSKLDDIWLKNYCPKNVFPAVLGRGNGSNHGYRRRNGCPTNTRVQSHRWPKGSISILRVSRDLRVQCRHLDTHLSVHYLFLEVVESRYIYITYIMTKNDKMTKWRREKPNKLAKDKGQGQEN